MFGSLTKKERISQLKMLSFWRDVYSDSIKQKFQVNSTSGLKSTIAKTITSAQDRVIRTFTQITKGIITSIGYWLGY